MTLLKRLLGALAASGAVASGCSSDPDIGGETHWLDECVTDADCSGGRSCLCGVCTIGCEGDGDCSDSPLPSQCYDVSAPGLAAHCQSSAVPQGAVCLATCQTDDQCPTGERCAGGGACLPDEPPEGSEPPPTTNIFVDELPAAIGAERVDLLFVIDNSISMADKQEVLARTVPRLVDRLINPDCVEPGGARSRVGSPDDACPDGARREFPAVTDLHVGVISSSLGTVSEQCASSEQKNDRGHLIGSRPRAAALGLPEPFLSWTPGSGGANASGLSEDFQSLVRVVGEQGCGYEAPLEAMYRFLADPEPPETIAIVPCSPGSTAECAQPTGIDSELLQQRAQFLRPDSLLGVLLLSDENDCSIQQTGQLYYAARNIELPKASAACSTNPNDPCCYNCALSPPSECSSPDPTCKDANGRTVTVPLDQDNANLRCWEQVRRFGVDFLHDTDRYVNALSAPTLCAARSDLDVTDCSPGNIHANPIFSDLSGGGGPVRSPSQVIFTPIVGVPWQDLAVNPSAATLRFKQSGEIPWAVILGDPTASPPDPPDDPLMRESVVPRMGSNPVTGEPLAPPSAGYMANAINGHEWDILDNDDLQYACIFPLVQPKDCATTPPEQGCDCREFSLGTQNPLCQAPDGSYGTLQYAAKAYPGTRHLQVAQGLGRQAAVGSICPRNLTDPAAQDFGYGPSLDAFVDRAATGLVPACLPRELVVTEQPGGAPETACTLLEAAPSGTSCTGPGRQAPSDAAAAAVYRRLQTNGVCSDCEAVFTVCELAKSTADDDNDGTADCLQDGADPSEPGWCYIDPAQGLGDPELVAHCPATERRQLRLIGSDLPAAGARLFVSCSGQ